MLFIFCLYSTACFSNSLTLYVIKPKFSINWSNPHSLAVSTGLNSVGNDYAPIGHFAIKISCDGHPVIMTGMERENRKESQRITLDKKLGLGSMFYTFKGSLQSSENVKDEITHAKIDGRLRTILVPTSELRCSQMIEFVEKWIESGAYTQYGGNKNALKMQGAGCADFAMALFEIAAHTPPQDWFVSNKVPNSLIGDGETRFVNFSKILSRFSWASEKERYRTNYIADTNKVTDWINKRTDSKESVLFYTSHHDDIMTNPYTHIIRPEFEFPHTEDINETWKKIQL